MKDLHMTGHFGITDIDGLTLAVRDVESRRLISDAIAAYRGGALRSAIVSTWIAVAFDIIVKSRELANLGEAAPRAFVDELDEAIKDNDKGKLQKFESDLIDKANYDLQLLAPHEYNAFKRLQQDRHLCAHPAYVVEGELFQPSPEQVRAHIVHALEYLLIHAPLQGKSAIARFEIDLESSSFPDSAEEIGVFLRAKYLDRAKDVLVINLLKAILSAPFGTEHKRYEKKVKTLALSFREIANAKSLIYDSVIPSFVAEKLEQAADVVLLRICPFLKTDPRIWGWLKESDRTRVRRLLETADVETLKSCGILDVDSISPLSDSLRDRFESFDEDVQIDLISDHPKKEFVNRGIELYADAGTYRHAEALGWSVILPLAQCFEAEDVEAVLKAASSNSQIWLAGGTTEILERLFDITLPLLSDTRSRWMEFVESRTTQNEGDASVYYSYPGLRRRLDQHP